MVSVLCACEDLRRKVHGLGGASPKLETTTDNDKMPTDRLFLPLLELPVGLSELSKCSHREKQAGKGGGRGETKPGRDPDGKCRG